MDLVLSKDKDASLSTWKDYAPLIVIISVILLTTITLAVRDLGLGMFSLENTLSYFMIGFFLIFATFKLMDLKGFAHGYQTYDILAQKIPLYGHVYPFIELFFGLAMIVIPLSTSLLITEFVVMMFSGLGVAIKIAKKEEFMCVCLGTFLKIPLTKVTLIENFGMAALAIAMLLLQAL
ncbi:MAG: MauE/DoxX family redox-associated membrane protein [Candidatus Colwellbacteria bacterium]